MCNDDPTQIPILAKSTNDFTYLAGTATQTIILIPCIDMAHHRVHLLVRLHASQTSAGQRLDFDLDHPFEGDEGPVVDFDLGADGETRGGALDALDQDGDLDVDEGLEAQDQHQASLDAEERAGGVALGSLEGDEGPVAEEPLRVDLALDQDGDSDGDGGLEAQDQRQASLDAEVGDDRADP